MSQQTFVVAPSKGIGGRITVPGDKSISHRALLFNAIAEGTSVVDGLLEGEDCLATLMALRTLGVPISRQKPGRYQIEGVGPKGLSSPFGPLDLGNSGTAMRLMAGLLAGKGIDAVLVGDASLSKRPMGRVAGPLGAMGASIRTVAGCPPITIGASSGLSGLRYDLPVASAQVKSALLLAALDAKGLMDLAEPAVTRDHTERMFSAMGCPVERRDGRILLNGPQTLTAVDISVPGDFSSAAFFLVAGCMGAEHSFHIEGVGLNPSRIGLLAVLDLMGAQVRLNNRRTVGGEPVADLEVHRSPLRGVDVPASLVPLAIDEFPIIFVAACAARGTTRITGAEELRHKESDRIKAMVDALSALGASVSESPDGAVIHGGGLRGGEVDSHGDHRVAMALAVSSLIAQAPIRINDVANVATSFPGFQRLATRVGLEVEDG